MNKQVRQFFLALCILLLGSQPCWAFNWGYSPYTGSSNLLWLGRSFLNPGNMLYRGGYGYSAPYYLINSLAWNAAYAAGQGINNAARRSMNQAYWSNAGPQMPTSSAVDQIAFARWASARPGATGYAASPIINAQDPLQNPDDPFFIPQPQTYTTQTSYSSAPLVPSQAPTYTPVQNALTEPPKAPPFVPSVNAARNSPFVHAFIDHVNGKFKGDLAGSLKDKETRKYAAAIGLIDSEDAVPEISAANNELSKKILSDQHEEIGAKIATLRLLIKHSQPNN